jgi:hypothetical protein
VLQITDALLILAAEVVDALGVGFMDGSDTSL